MCFSYMVLNIIKCSGLKVLGSKPKSKSFYFPLMVVRRSLDIFSKVDEVGVGLTVKIEVSAYQEFQC